MSKAKPNKRSILALSAAWLLAVIVTAGLGTFASAQFVIADLSAVGAAVPISERLAMTGNDLAGLMPLYALFIAIGFAIAFPVAALLSRFVIGPGSLVFVGAGATSMAVMLLAMEQVFFGVPIIAGARSGLGFLVQALCGAGGGYVFVNFRRAKPARDTLSHDDILPV